MRDRTVRYAVACTIEGPGTLTGPLEYPVKHCGKPSEEGLERFVEKYNAHGEITITAAALYDGATLVATWSA